MKHIITKLLTLVQVCFLHLTINIYKHFTFFGNLILVQHLIYSCFSCWALFQYEVFTYFTLFSFPELTFLPVSWWKWWSQTSTLWPTTWSRSGCTWHRRSSWSRGSTVMFWRQLRDCTGPRGSLSSRGSTSIVSFSPGQTGRRDPLGPFFFFKNRKSSTFL